MALVNMRSSAEEAAEIASPEAPEYPYGLRISLNDDDMEKLGLTQLPAVGTKMTVTAQVEVCSASAYSDKDGEPEMSVSLQITDMELSGAAQGADAATMLYGS